MQFYLGVIVVVASMCNPATPSCSAVTLFPPFPSLTFPRPPPHLPHRPCSTYRPWQTVYCAWPLAFQTFCSADQVLTFACFLTVNESELLPNLSVFESWFWVQTWLPAEPLQSQKHFLHSWVSSVNKLEGSLGFDGTFGHHKRNPGVYL